LRFINCRRRQPATLEGSTQVGEIRVEGKLGTGTDAAPTAPASAWKVAASLASVLVESQRLQLQALVQCQELWLACTSEAFEQWACRFGGGVPIDG
jgi:hypothetical protein